jgi:hypothetical protein
MSIVLLNQKKDRKIQKISKEKTIPYPGFEPRTSGLAVGSLNHCTIGLVMVLRMPAVSIDFSTFLIVDVDLFFKSFQHFRPISGNFKATIVCTVADSYHNLWIAVVLHFKATCLAIRKNFLDVVSGIQSFMQSLIISPIYDDINTIAQLNQTNMSIIVSHLNTFVARQR